jgi:hypothetical protein
MSTLDDAGNIVVAGDGDIWVAPENTAAPAFKAAPASPWDVIGYATEDGVMIGYDRTVTAVNAWQALGALRNLTTDVPMAITFTCIELKPDSVQLAFRGGTLTSTATKGTYTAPDAETQDIRAVLIRGLDGASTFDFYFPRCEMQGSHQLNLQRTQESRVPVELGVLFAVPRFTIASDHPSWVSGP